MFSSRGFLSTIDNETKSGMLYQYAIKKNQSEENVVFINN